ncbi:high mobility group protein 20A isoform X2 [Mirounga leonina]|uniref:high mobility group protein 20A isoform X2 n=1 Tax=Mirounga leonina TaxID=9715 RepID=UPI00156C45BF|nr:high mobility group protein 20A isoform X2 [Mirounga leonina]
MCMLAHSVPARLTRTDPRPAFRKSGRAHFQMCGRVAQDGRPSGEPAPSAVLAGKHHDGGEGPGGSRKLAAQIKPTAGPRYSEEGLRLLASQTLSLQGAGFPPSSWLSLCFVVMDKPEMKKIYNKTPASPSIRWSCSREGAEQWCCSCPRTWPAGPGKARQGGQPAQGETARPSAALRPHPCLRTQLPEALLAPKASAEGRLPPPRLRHTGSPKGPPELAQPSAQLRLQAEAELPPPLLAACQDSNTAVGPPLAPGPSLRRQGRQTEGEGEKQRAVLVQDDVDVFSYNGTVESLEQRTYDLQSLKYLLSGCLQKKTADLSLWADAGRALQGQGEDEASAGADS